MKKDNLTNSKQTSSSEYSTESKVLKNIALIGEENMKANPVDNFQDL